jgi:hypothetical protein
MYRECALASSGLSGVAVVTSHEFRLETALFRSYSPFSDDLDRAPPTMRPKPDGYGFFDFFVRGSGVIFDPRRRLATH